MQEEEDEYDKVAAGEPEDRLYTTEISDYGIDIDSDNMLPNSFDEVVKDPRANHLAAKIRLQEDAEAAKRINSLRVSEKDARAPTSFHTETNSSDNGVNPRSILKRKDNQLDSKSEKRVRFDPECKDNSGTEVDPEGAKGITMEPSTEVAGDHPSGVPDYLQNPAKYTHYTFDSSSDMDEESNKQAYMDFLKLLKKSDNMEPPPEDSADLSKAVKFIPKKRIGDATMVEACTEVVPQVGIHKDTVHRRGMPISIAADDDVCAMEEDGPEMAAEGRDSLQKTGRHYRKKGRSEVDE